MIYRTEVFVGEIKIISKRVICLTDKKEMNINLNDALLQQQDMENTVRSKGILRARDTGSQNQRSMLVYYVLDIWS